MSSFVVDASVVVGLFVKEPHSTECIKFFDKLSDANTRFLAPDALARREGLPLITTDERLVGGTQGKGFDVRSIADV